MWIADDKLSRLRTGHTSCATIASNWSGVRCSLRPSGSKRKGRKTPNTPGSRRAELDSTGIGRFKGRGDAARQTVRTCRQRRHHAKQLAANPHSHKLTKTAGAQLGALFANKRVGDANTANGPLFCPPT